MNVVQNQDIAASPSMYPVDGSIKVTSIFRTLQGEAPFTGYPAVFLRLAGCNYGAKTNFCQFCDTSFQLDQAQTFNPQDLIDQLYQIRQQGDILVLTGGEPSLQANIISILEALLDLDVFTIIQIETNLTNAKFWEQLYATGKVVREPNKKGIYVVGSPKANYKTGKTPKPSDFLLTNVVGCVKVLVNGEGTPNAELPEWLNEVSAHVPVYLSPIAVYNKPYAGEVSSIWDTSLINHPATQANYQKAAALAIANGYKLSLQTHLFTSIP